jgi:hypothetical protein
MATVAVGEVGVAAAVTAVGAVGVAVVVVGIVVVMGTVAVMAMVMTTMIKACHTSCSIRQVRTGTAPGLRTRNTRLTNK